MLEETLREMYENGQLSRPYEVRWTGTITWMPKDIYAVGTDGLKEYLDLDDNAGAIIHVRYNEGDKLSAAIGDVIIETIFPLSRNTVVVDAGPTMDTVALAERFTKDIDVCFRFDHPIIKSEEAKFRMTSLARVPELLDCAKTARGILMMSNLSPKNTWEVIKLLANSDTPNLEYVRVIYMYG